jgi:5'-nucleotidase
MDGSRWQGLGGAERRAEYIASIRKRHEHVLLFDSGDIFQGTPYFNFYKGELELKLMDEMAYDATTIGNHDFDAGIDQLARLAKRTSFPFLNCNYDISQTPLLGITQPYATLEKAGIKIGITGVGINPIGLVPADFLGKVGYIDPVSPADQIAKRLKEEEFCDIVICLSHLGYQYKSDQVSDIILAEKSNYIDIILGGHTHTFMPAPVEVFNQSGRRVIINQVGWAGVMIGRLDLEFGKNRKGILTTSKNQFLRKAE